MVELPRGGRLMLGVLIFGTVATIAYWVVWFGVDRELLAAAHTPEYYAYENAFPLADGWMVLAGIAATLALLRRRASAFLFSVLAGSSSIFLGLLDVLFDLEHGIYASPDTGAVAVEVTINALTLAMGAAVVVWAWRVRRELARFEGF